MIVGSTKEDLSLEKRVALTPEVCKKYYWFGFKNIFRKNYADSYIKDEEFQKCRN